MLALSLFIFSTILMYNLSYGYDPLDAKGNITIQWDITEMNSAAYNAEITIYNFQEYRHIESPPGWRLSWEWDGDEVIWNMQGAEAKEQGVCNKSLGLGTPPPHCCLKRPLIIDLQPGTAFNKQTTNCCRAGILTSMTQDSTKYTSHFQMSVGFAASSSKLNFRMPNNFTFGTPGYTCGDLEAVAPTQFPEDGGRRWRQALSTYKVICTYSQFIAAPAPTCCVSLSAFYSTTIIFCPNCSCGCQNQPGSSCIKKGEIPQMLPKSEDPDYVPPPLVNCTTHMCPIHVHWHIKESYREYWRVKITIMNLNIRKNYTTWNLAVEHPNLNDLVQVFSFNYMPLTQYRPTNDTGLFWGIQYYNDVLLKSGESGNVQTEMLLRKVPGTFTFDAGWAFPKRIYFNGENCVMPLPDDFPRLPNESRHVRQ